MCNFQKLNGSEIPPEERRGAEYDYMKCHGREWLAARDDPALLRNFESLHPRYLELIRSESIIIFLIIFVFKFSSFFSSYYDFV